MYKPIVLIKDKFNQGLWTLQLNFSQESQSLSNPKTFTNQTLKANDLLKK